jgi:hypothetical protein
MPLPIARAGNTLLQCLQWDRDPSQKSTPRCDHAMLQPVQANPGKAQPTFPVGIDAEAFSCQADRINLQRADQDSDCNHQQQPINPLGAAQPIALKLEDPRILVAEELLTAEALPVGPDQIQAGPAIGDQVPGLSCCDADGSGQDQIGPLAALPELHIPDPRQWPRGRRSRRTSQHIGESVP